MRPPPTDVELPATDHPAIALALGLDAVKLARAAPCRRQIVWDDHQ
jgi:hypothetical protein